MNINIKLSELINQFNSKERNDRVDELIIISDYTAVFSGKLSAFYNNADVNKALDRDKLLKSDVKSYTYKPISQRLIAII